jgi:Plasmid pRiA4b ORF-3-like protein
MGRTSLSIRVELVEGCGERFWPRPGRVFVAARTHSFAQLAEAIDIGFARWDRSHLHEFTLDDGTRLTTPFEDDEEDEEEDLPALDDRRTKLGRLSLGERFVYVFDLGDDWTHLCTVGDELIDPMETLGIRSAAPLPYSGWGDLPDQYRRRWEEDDGESEPPGDSFLADLPPLRPSWGIGGPSGQA